ncbi:MAG: hypothetical protein HKN87_11100 [Saprospiraceae bacterium]|nr:hypothetical protein [Saprospiraceae bacterium]
MMNRFLQFLTILSVTALVSCSPNYKPFTVDLQDSYNWSEDELKKIQFYLSQEIVLQRNLSKGESVIEGGKIQVREGRRIEEIRIPEGTPGVLMFMPKPNRLAISFERGKDRFLIFGPHPKRDGTYVLLGSDWDRRSGEVTYRGKKYRTSSQSAYAALLVDLERVSKVSLARHTAKGRTVR